MPRLDVRVKTKLSAKIFFKNGKEGTTIQESIIISELSLRGALLDNLCHEPKDIIGIKPRFQRINNIDLIGEVVRIIDRKIAVKFLSQDMYTKARLWEWIRSHLVNTNICNYCNHQNNNAAEYCESCNLFINFDDKTYLEKHDRRTFTARLHDRAVNFNSEERQKVLDFMDTLQISERCGNL